MANSLVQLSDAESAAMKQILKNKAEEIMESRRWLTYQGADRRWRVYQWDSKGITWQVTDLHFDDPYHAVVELDKLLNEKFRNLCVGVCIGAGILFLLAVLAIVLLF